MHNCPNCGQDCDCSGDIDDIPVYTEAWVIQNCRHDCDEDEPYIDDSIDWQDWELCSEPTQTFDRTLEP